MTAGGELVDNAARVERRLLDVWSTEIKRWPFLPFDSVRSTPGVGHSKPDVQLWNAGRVVAVGDIKLANSGGVASLSGLAGLSRLALESRARWA